MLDTGLKFYAVPSFHTWVTLMDLKKKYIKVFRGKVRFRRATLPCNGSYFTYFNEMLLNTSLFLASLCRTWCSRPTSSWYWTGTQGGDRETHYRSLYIILDEDNVELEVVAKYTDSKSSDQPAKLQIKLFCFLFFKQKVLMFFIFLNKRT